jgi:hypothetical protein
MPFDNLLVLDAAIIALFIAVYVAAAFRAIQLGRAFVNRVYRSLANLFALVAITLLAAIVVIYPQIFYNAYNISITITLTRDAYLIVLVGFFDRIALAAKETDFFHRDSLHWRSIRKPLYAAGFGFGFIYVIISNFVPPGTPGELVLAIEIALFMFATIWVGYLVALLFVSARRTYDMTLKRTIRLLALSAILSFAAAPFNSVVEILIVHDVFTLLGAYVFYRAVMSLSPIGRVPAPEAPTVVVPLLAHQMGGA